MKSGGDRLLKFMFLFLSPLIFFSCSFSNYIYPEYDIINIDKYYKFDIIPKKFESVLENGIIIEVYSYINYEFLFEEIHKSFDNSFNILDEYLNFSTEILKNKKIKWKIYLCQWDYKIKNFKIKWKNENKNEFLILKNVIFLYDNKDKWKEDIKLSIAYLSHELSHNYFIYWEKRKRLKLISWFEEGFAEFIRYKCIENEIEEKAILALKELEKIKKDKKLRKNVWEFKVLKLMRKYKLKLFFMKISFQSKQYIQNYILSFWRNYDNLYLFSFGIIKTMEEYYGKEKFKEILKMYRDGIEKEKLKKMAEEAIKAKW